MSSPGVWLAAVAVALGMSGETWAGLWRGRAAACFAPATTCAPKGGCQLVEKTVMVPRVVMVPQRVRVVECRPEVREQTVTVWRRVPETRAVKRTYTVMVPRQVRRTVTWTECEPVWREVEQRVTVMVPHQEVRQGVRRVCKPVLVEETQTVCVDRGHWEERPCPTAGRCAPACGACRRLHRCCVCGGCGVHKVWVPNVVREQRRVQVPRVQVVEEPYQYTATVCRPEQRVRRVRVCEYRRVQRQAEVVQTVCVPEVRECAVNVTTYRCVAEQRVVRCTVMVPHVVEKVVQRPVCQLVPQVVTCRVPASCGRCGG